MKLDAAIVFSTKSATMTVGEALAILAQVVKKPIGSCLHPIEAELMEYMAVDNFKPPHEILWN
jgi:hypothetical protein